MSDDLLSIVAGFEVEADAFVSACSVALENSPCVERVTGISINAKREWNRIATGRGLALPTIAFVGSIDSGKSWLAQMLLSDQAMAAQLLPAGDSRKTARLHWVGPERPSALVSDVEHHTHLDSAQMANLGVPYQLLDTPGSGDTDRHCQELAHNALSSARVKVLVVRSRKIRAEEYLKFISSADGALILPIINFCPGEEAQRSELVQDLLTALKRALPTSQILSPLCFPDIETVADASEAQADIRDSLIGTLRRVLTNDSDDIEAASFRQLNASHKRFLSARNEIVSPFVTPLIEPFSNLEKAEQALPAQALEYLLGDPSKLRVLLNHHFRASLLDRTPRIAFPYRSILGLVLLTTGAWDRLILGVGGSLPSLLATGVAAAKNIKASRQANFTLRDRVKAILMQMVRKSLHAPIALIWQRLGASASVASSSAQEIDFEVIGTEELAATWNREVADAAEQHRPARVLVALAWITSVAAFWFLFGAPLVHLYGEYVPAALRSWNGDWAATIVERYPAASSSFWLTSFLLSILPVFVVCLVVVAASLSVRRARCAEERLRLRMDEQLRTGSIGFSVVLRDPRITAARFLVSQATSNTDSQ